MTRLGSRTNRWMGQQRSKSRNPLYPEGPACDDAEGAAAYRYNTLKSMVHGHHER